MPNINSLCIWDATIIVSNKYRSLEWNTSTPAPPPQSRGLNTAPSPSSMGVRGPRLHLPMEGVAAAGDREVEWSNGKGVEAGHARASLLASSAWDRSGGVSPWLKNCIEERGCAFLHSLSPPMRISHRWSAMSVGSGFGYAPRSAFFRLPCAVGLSLRLTPTVGGKSKNVSHRVLCLAKFISNNSRKWCCIFATRERGSVKMNTLSPRCIS
jgi:hypothetical protein